MEPPSMAATSDTLPTATRVSDPGIRALYQLENRWQAWLDVEAALARAQAELGIIPADAAEAIAAKARLDLMDRARIDEGFARTGHTIVPLVWELGRIVGEPHGGWVHWGATTQNITQTGDLLVLRQAHAIFLRQIGEVLSAMADLAERTADMPMAGRTHGQHAVPATFGYKVAVWIDELLRHVERLRQAAPRLFIAMLGGGAGTYASLGKQGPPVQQANVMLHRIAAEFEPQTSRAARWLYWHAIAEPIHQREQRLEDRRRLVAIRIERLAVAIEYETVHDERGEEQHRCDEAELERKVASVRQPDPSRQEAAHLAEANASSSRPSAKVRQRPPLSLVEELERVGISRVECFCND